MAETGHGRTNTLEPIEIEGSHGNSLTLSAFGENRAPRIANQSMAVGDALRVVTTGLRCRQNERLTLDCSRAKQRMPMIFPRVQGERRRNNKTRRTTLNQNSIEF